jgi:hypothetical protein
MSGKRAKPSPWRFVRLVPVALVAMVVCAMLGLFLLLQDPGDDQAHDWGVDPAPSGSREPSANGRESRAADSPSPSATATTSPSHQATAAQQRDASTDPGLPPETHVPKARVRRASAPPPASQPPQPTKAPTPEATVPVVGPAQDNPGKKKGHHKDHGPHGHPHR